MALTKIWPFAQNVPIVYPDTGNPTPYFNTQLQLLLEASGVFEEDIATLSSTKADKSIEIIAGDGLDGGGDLSADVTIDANVQDILDLISTTQGTILYRGASDWAALAPGTSGQYLKTQGSGANPVWATVSAGGAAWTVIHSAATGTVSSVDITGLSAYNELLIMIVEVTASVSGVRQVLLSVNNGASYYNSAGNYKRVPANGVLANDTAYLYHGTATTAARTMVGHIKNLKGTMKIATDSHSDNYHIFDFSSSDVDAIRISNSGGGNLTGGVIHVLGR